jgi:NADPH-dependent curcumin reductase CurA
MQQITLARRPQGLPVPEDFALRKSDIPQPADGEVLIAVTHFSLDPYMRGRMDDVKSYAPSTGIGEAMTAQGVGRVLTSRAKGFAEGDLVMGVTGWSSHAVAAGNALRKLDDALPPTTALGVLGMPGFTAWAGLEAYGEMKAGETLVVAAATGPVGSMVGQLARLKGLRTIAVAGGAAKCALACDSFGFDAAFDHRAHDARSLRKALAEAAPDGVDIYWENVGGKVFEAVLPLMNTHGRIPVCGTISMYSGVNTDGPDRLPALMRTVLVKRLKLCGLIIFDHYDRFDAFHAEIAPRVASGEIAWREDIAEGIETAPAAFISMLGGGNTGKQLVAI